MIPSHSRKKKFYYPLLLIVMTALACNAPAHFFATPTYPVPTLVWTASPTQTPFLPSIPSPQPTSTVTPAPVPTATITPFPAISYQPFFEPVQCRFPIPPGMDPQCGDLVVPENRTLPGSHSIRLHVAIFKSRSSHPAADPVVYLAGGPGSSALGVAQYMFSRGFDAILDQRDLIFIDQRGTGYSQPVLDCSERVELERSLLGDTLLGKQAAEETISAFQRCRDRLSAAGIDLSAYNSAASSADVEDLRQALGIGQVNLYGDSYGTRLALTVMRDHPRGIRSVILDSVYPPQVNLYTTLARNAQRAFEVLFGHCTADPACSRAHPDLSGRFYSLVDELNAHPKPVNVYDPISGEEVPVKVSGNILVDTLFTGLYNRDVTVSMPAMIDQVEKGDYRLLAQRLSLYFDASTSLGMQMSVQCREEIPFSFPGEAFQEAEGLQPQIAAFFPASVQVLFQVCHDWGAGTPNPIENQPVRSEIPTLLLTGEYDPITPPSWTYLAAETLPRSYVVEFPGVGHWTMRSGACPMQIGLSFLEDPGAPPDTGCVTQMGGLNFTR